MTAIRRSSRGLVVSLMALAASSAGGLATAQSAQEEAQAERDKPPTTLPFEPTVRSAPPGFSPETDRRPRDPTPQSPPPPPPPPGDPLCYEVGPYIREGVSANRFATLSAGTREGSVIGSFEAGEALKEAGAGACTVAIPGASEVTRASPYNQVTCPLAMDQSDIAHLEDFKQRRDTLTERLAQCPAMAEWTPRLEAQGDERDGSFTADQVFRHPDVPVEVLVRAAQHRKSGQWPDNYVRTLSLILRTPNPDRPEPEPDPGEANES